MGALLQNTVFGRTKYRANTFIGGIGNTFNTPALIANKIGISVSRIKSFRIIGDDVEFAIIGDAKYTLAAGAFMNNTNITYFHDQDGKISYILYSAFSGATNLKSAIFPSIITVDGSGYAAAGVFYNCYNLEYFSALKLETTGSYMFQGCSKIKAFNFPVLNEIKGAPFSGCSSLETINAETVTIIGGGSFRNCGNLQHFNCDNVEIIGDSAFINCSKLMNITGLSKVKDIKSYAFYGCSNLEGIITAPMVTTIGYQVFYNCHKITDYYFPELLTLEAAGSITWTFYNNSSVNSIYIPKVTALGTPGYNAIFVNIKSGCIITVSNSLKTINSGTPDSDILYAQDTRGGNIIYI
jgi:hypothetical protein